MMVDLSKAQPIKAASGNAGAVAGASGKEHPVGTVAGKKLFRITFGNIGIWQGNVRKPFADG